MLNDYTTNKETWLTKPKAKYANGRIDQQGVKATAYLNNRVDSEPKMETNLKHKLYQQNGRWFSQTVEQRRNAKKS